MSRERRGRAPALVAFALLGTSVILPTLVGLLAVDLTSDLGFNDTALGMVVGAFWLVTAFAAPVCGRWVDARGWPTGAVLGALVTAASLLACVLCVRSWAALVAVLAVSGIGYALCSPTSNILVVTAVRPGRVASVLGLKQTAPPLVMATAGATLPAIAHAHGWRLSMAFGLLLPLAVGTGVWLLLASGVPARREVREPAYAVVARPPVEPVHAVPAAVPPARPLRSLPVVIAAGLGTLAVATVTGFGVLTLVQAGLGTVTAAGVVSGASLVAVLARVASGAHLDTRAADDVAALLVLMVVAVAALGAVALGILGESFMPEWAALTLVVIGVSMSLVAAWTWPALLLLTVVRRSDGPGAASGLLQLGSGLGSAVGPLAFGALSDAGGPGWGWALMAAGTAVAARLVLRSTQ